VVPVKTNKKKIINDPVYGFINISFDSLFEIVEHPYFQRLRRIKQLGLTYFVYPGATHTRFQHALGSLHLMSMAIQVLRSKAVEITPEEEEAALAAILLHDMGHGPFSHVLEESIAPGIHHEALSLLFMHALNKDFKGRLDLAIQIFTGQYHKQFLHQLISGQLDMDRLDYLKRDSFFTGVTEGVIGSDRIVRMLNVVDDQLVVDHKGIYSIEKFLIARRLMYWQVYLHKAVLSSEMLLLNILQRARKLAGQGVELFCTPSLHYFLYQQVSSKDLFRDEKGTRNPKISEATIRNLEMFAGLDDSDIMASAKVWTDQPDRVLSILCKKLKNRDLSRIEIRADPLPGDYIKAIRQNVKEIYNLQDDEIDYLVYAGTISNYAYSSEDEQIQILYNDGELKDITRASDMLDIAVLSKTVRKYFLYYPKDAIGTSV
jgi:HD superfamily phosphohydrolase